MKAACSIYFALLLPAFSAQYFVRIDGNDSNAGTANSSGSAWRKVQKAANTLVAGDTVTIVAGDYDETVTETTGGHNTSPITYQASGVVTINRFVCSGAFIIVDGININGPDATHNGSGGLIDLTPGADGCQFRNMRLTGQAASARDGLGGISMDFPGPDFCTFTNIAILDPNYTIVEFYGKSNLIVNSWIAGNAGWDAFRVIYSDYNTIRNVQVTNRSDYGTLVSRHPDFIQSFADERLPIQHLTVENSTWVGRGTGDDTQFGNITDDNENKELSDWTFRNNLFVNIPRTMNLYAPGFKFLHNTFYRCGGDSSWVIIGGDNKAGHGSNTVLLNNIFFECGVAVHPGNGWYIFDATNGMVADYNLVIGSGAGTTKVGYQVYGREKHGINGLNPLFLDATRGDFRLQPGSPAIGTGTNLFSVVPGDKNGNARAMTNPSMGAFEGAAGLSATNSPSQLRASPQ